MTLRSAKKSVADQAQATARVEQCLTVASVPAGLKPSQAWARNKVLCSYIGISTMALWRWLHDPELNCPQPVQINNILYHNLSEWDAWLRARAVVNADAAAKRRKRFEGKTGRHASKA